MQTLTEIVAAVVVHSSAAAYAHFGVPLEAHQVDKPSAPVAERAIPRSAQRKAVKVSDCPQPKVRVVKT